MTFLELGDFVFCLLTGVKCLSFFQDAVCQHLRLSNVLNTPSQVQMGYRLAARPVCSKPLALTTARARPFAGLAGLQSQMSRLRPSFQDSRTAAAALKGSRLTTYATATAEPETDAQEYRYQAEVLFLPIYVHNIEYIIVFTYSNDMTYLGKFGVLTGQ